MTYGYDLLNHRRTARNPYLRDRGFLTRGYADVFDGVWWRGTDNTLGTLVTVTGSQTVVEAAVPRPELQVSALASIGANDINSLLYAKTISVGQTWACQVFPQATTLAGTLLLAALVFTDGTTSTSNVVGTFNQLNNNGNVRLTGRSGTLTNLSAEHGAALEFNVLLRSPWLLTLNYTASNSFTMGWNIPGGLDPATATATPTITPTHVGVAWTNWGTSPPAPLVTFGPIYRTT